MREHLYEALDYVARGKVRVMNELFPLEEISDAYDKVANGNVFLLNIKKPEIKSNEKKSTALPFLVTNHQQYTIYKTDPQKEGYL